MKLLSVVRRGAVATVALLSLAVTVQAAEPSYTAVVDAGSGGTRLFFYKVMPGPYPTNELLLNKSSEDVPDTPYEEDDGIDNYACFTGDDPVAREFYATANVNPYVMEPLWGALKERIKSITPAITPADLEVKVFATAGMRTAVENCGQAPVDELFDVIRSGMTAAGLTNPANEARIIDGATEEGLWSFINANDEYANAFDRPGNPKPPQAPVGMLEVGGSSVQIVYPIAPASPGPNTVQININNRVFTVHAQSWLHLGQDDMRKSLRNYKTRFGRYMAYKCWVKGFDKASDAGDVGFASLTQNGAFNPRDPSCAAFMRSYTQKYLVAPPDLSSVPVKFVGLGGLKYTLDAFGVIAGPLAGAKGLAANVIARCSRNASLWPEINTSKDTQRMCPHGAYIATLLLDRRIGLFRRKPGQFDRALVAKDVGGKALSWISGYLLLTYAR
jgi:hypothetical protein